MKSPNEFLVNLASKVKQPKVIIAQKFESEKLSPQEEATGHAKNYWWVGYNWDEIESVLIDLGYPEKVIDKAIENAKNYAKQVLKGPFTTLKIGQYIKLNNNQVGVVDCVCPKSVTAFFDEEVMQVSEKDINWKDTKKLSEAFALRISANKLSQEAQNILPLRPEEFVPAEVLPEEMETFTTKVKRTPGAPSGFGDYPHVKDVKEVTSNIEKMLIQIEAAEDKLEEVKEELAIANQMANEIRSKRKKLLREQLEVAQDIFAIIGSQNKDLAELEGTYFEKYKDKLIGLRRNVVENAEVPGVLEELQILKSILEVNHPKVFKNVMNVLNQYMEANSKITETIEKSFVMFQPRKQKTSQLWERVKNWAAKLWAKVRGTSDSINEEIIPAIDDTIAAIDKFEELYTIQVNKFNATRLIESNIKNL